jgi:hypothetical protein
MPEPFQWPCQPPVLLGGLSIRGRVAYHHVTWGRSPPRDGEAAAE